VHLPTQLSRRCRFIVFADRIPHLAEAALPRWKGLIRYSR
jgi:hypothetical protein